MLQIVRCESYQEQNNCHYKQTFRENRQFPLQKICEAAILTRKNFRCKKDRKVHLYETESPISSSN